MMPRQDHTIWSPDTCSCQIMYDNNGNVLDEKQMRQEQLARIAAGDRTANTVPLRVLRDVCPEHQNLGHLQKGAALLSVLVEENIRKKLGIQIALDNVPGLKESDIDWSLDAARVLILNLPSGKCTNSQANALIGLYTSAFGQGKVKVNRF